MLTKVYPVALIPLVIATIVAWVYCKHPPRPEVAACEEPDREHECDSYSCGTNSPTINGFPLNGLRPDGECNKEGVQLVPGSMMGGDANSCAGLTLDLNAIDRTADDHGMNGNVLVGRDRNGIIKCEGKQLLGASFEVRSWQSVSSDNHNKKSVRIRITDITDYTNNENGEIRTAYRLVRDVPSSEPKTLCSAAGALDLRDALGLKKIDGLATTLRPGEDVVIPIDSEMYDVLGKPFEIDFSWRLRRREWMNLACVDDALAKRSLYRLHTDNLGRSRAALRMLTANYCGHKPMTMRGVHVAWGCGQPDLEARWTQVGASCLSKPRVLYKDEANPSKVPADLPDSLKKICNGKECDSIAAWTEAARICKRGATTYTLQPCPEGSDTDCERDSLTSFVVPPEH